MEKVINSYETMFIVDVTAGEEAAKATAAKFTDIIAKNAEVVEVATWLLPHRCHILRDRRQERC